jgi:hypothetical protein
MILRQSGLELGAIVDPDDTEHGAPARRRVSGRNRGGRVIDDRPEVQTLFSNLKDSLPALQKLLEECRSHWGYEDPIYRLYHQSFKVYGLQDTTARIVAALRALAPERRMNPWFLQIVTDGTGKHFELEHNRRWLEVTRPIVEAFFHARYFLEMAVPYGTELKAPPRTLRSGATTVARAPGARPRRRGSPRQRVRDPVTVDASPNRASPFSVPPGPRGSAPPPPAHAPGPAARRRTAPAAGSRAPDEIDLAVEPRGPRRRRLAFAFTALAGQHSAH